MKGLPLALATAGSLLRQTSLSCAEYLDIHNSHWVSLYDTKDSELLDYNRTLASTWMVSADSVAQQDPDALALLKYLAYFGNQDIWYELVAAARQQNAACPAWMVRVTANRICFDRTIQKLVRHSLVDVIPGSYHLHPCLHDWLLARFNDPPDYQLFTLATQCIHSYLCYEVGDISVFRTAPVTGRLRAHLRRVRLPCFNALWIMKAREERCPEITCAFTSQDSPRTVKSMDDSILLLGPMLEQRKQAFRDLNLETAMLAHELGPTLLRLHRYQEAKQPLRLALDGFKQILGPEDVCTLHCYWRLGQLYNVMGDSSEAEKMLNYPISSVTALLDKDVIVPKSLRNCYLFCLVMRARLAKGSSKLSRPCIRELIKLAQTTREDESNVIYVCLGTMLQSCGDDANAQQAFSRSFVQVTEGVSIAPTTSCNGCGHIISSVSGWHVCRECIDVDLCHLCMANYSSKVRFVGLVTNCQGHAFFEAGSGTPVKRSRVDPWLQELVNFYGQGGQCNES